MARPFMQTGVTLPDEDLTPEFQAQQTAKQRAKVSATPSKKELAAMPAKAKKQLRETIAEQTATQSVRTTEVLNKLEESINQYVSDFDTFLTDIALQEAEAAAAAATAIEAETQGDETIIKAVEEGIIPYQGLPTVFQKTVNQQPQYKTTSDAVFTAVMASLEAVGVTGLADAMAQIRKLYPDISSEDALSLLKFDKRFNTPYLTRFAGNKMLMDAGFAMLDDKEYLATEKAFDKIFTSYDLNQFNNRDRFAKLIGNRISADELAARVSTAYDRVIKGAGETRKALEQLYPELTNADLVAYAIDPVNQLPALQRKVLSAEIGGAALAQNLSIGLQAAPIEKTGFTNVQRQGLGIETLVAGGETLETARKGFANVAEVLPTAEKLSAIYGARMEQYGRLQAEQEQFQDLASAKRAREKLSETEEAEFRGTAGRARVSRNIGGLIQNPKWTDRPHLVYRPVARASPLPLVATVACDNNDRKGGCYEQH